MAEHKVITGEVRFSYAHVFEPASVNGSDDKKYSVSIIVPKKDKKTISDIEKAIQAAMEEGVQKKFGGKMPKKAKTPLRDGDEDREDDPNYANSMFFNATSPETRRPGLVYRNFQPIIDTTDFYSGCYGHASVSFFPFNSNGNMGVGCVLNHIMKTRDGEPLGAVQTKAEDDFKGIITDDDDFMD